MDGCKLIIEYEVDCTFEFPDEDTDKSGIVILDKETEISKGKIRHSSPDIYLYTKPIRIQICNQVGGNNTIGNSGINLNLYRVIVVRF